MGVVVVVAAYTNKTVHTWCVLLTRHRQDCSQVMTRSAGRVSRVMIFQNTTDRVGSGPVRMCPNLSDRVGLGRIGFGRVMTRETREIRVMSRVGPEKIVHVTRLCPCLCEERWQRSPRSVCKYHL